ncbi:Steroid hormone receptor ERR2 isoform X3 [Aphelenchoides besseyi]|nr:Steroid hormone receptor ERR2 isoform X3 [Aphelenchoides besseyi]
MEVTEQKYETSFLMSSNVVSADDRLSRNLKNMKCLVCTSNLSHLNLGVKVCRACSSFYRRSIKERLRYVCQTSGNCNVEILDNRTKCKACRFEKCLRIGLNESALKNRRVYKGRHHSSESPPSLNFTSNKQTNSTLNDLVCGYDEFLGSQHSLFLAAHPDLKTNEKYCMPKMLGLAKMQQQSIPLLFTMFNKHYGPFAKLESKQKVDLLKSAYHDISNFHRAYLTSMMFPELDDNRIGVTNGYFLEMNISLIHEFMEGYMAEEKVCELAKHAMGLLTRKILRNCRRYKTLKIRKEDACCLWFLSVYKHAERLEIVNDEITQYKEQLVREWTNDLIHKFGEMPGAQHLTRVMSFNLESDMLAEEMANIQILAKVRWPNENNGDIEEFLDELSLED